MTLCLTTVVDAQFQRYIPLYLFCLQHSYPEYEALVFLTGERTGRLDKGLRHLKRSSRWAIIEGEFNGYPGIPCLPAYLRFLLFTEKRVRKYFSEYEYVFITDADLFIVRQHPTLLQQHQRHMKKLGLPYSNLLRDRLPNRLTGLHFCTAGYIKQVAAATTKHDRQFRESGGVIPGLTTTGSDEQLLYRIVRDSGVGMVPRHNPAQLEKGYTFSDPANCGRAIFRPWHGINVGYANQSERNWRLLPFRRAVSPFFHEVVAKFYRLSQLPGFQECYDLLEPGAKKAIWRMVSATANEQKQRFAA